ncbi:Uncharacterized protein ABC855_g1812 [[Candida] zeylanoides]
MAGPDGSFFLLQTENLEPLLGAIGKLKAQIGANQSVLAKVTSSIDEFGFPAGAGAGAGAGACDAPVDVDVLSVFLNDKYHLDKLQLNSETVASIDAVCAQRPPRVRRLMEDIARLERLRRDNSRKNHQLHEIILECELFLAAEVLPRLQRVAAQRRATAGEAQRRSAVSQLDGDAAVWAKYSQYMTQLHRVTQAGRQLCQLTKNLESGEMAALEQQLAAARRLRAELPS